MLLSGGVERSVNARVAGRYQLVREIGAGGMGRVFQAVDVQTGRAVAAKMLIAGDQVSLDALIRFQTEGAVLSALKHPNIVQVYGTHLEDHISCIIMELLEGRSLGQILRAERLPLARTKHLMQQVAAALAFAHSRGVVHRDVKPDNIMVTGQDQVKVTDFGIARVLQEGNTLRSLTTTGASIGTPLYMSPEQIEGQKVDGRTDIYSFGVVLFQMTTGQPPFEGDDPLTVAFKHVHKAPPPPSGLNPDLPDAWEEVILTCLAKSPDHRFQNAAALESALAALDTAPVTRPRVQPRAFPPEAPPDHQATRLLEAETNTLLQQARWKEQQGQYQDALRDYRSALTVASPGPVRDEVEAAITRLLSSQEVAREPSVSRPRRGPRGIVFAAGAVGTVAVLVLAAFLIGRVLPPTSNVHGTATAAALSAQGTAVARATSTAIAFGAAASTYPGTIDGPSAGTVTDPGHGIIGLGRATRPVQSFASVIRFHNPFGGSWDYGITFRNSGHNKEYRLVLGSDQRWYLVYGIQRNVQSGPASVINTTPGASNVLKAVVNGSELRVFVNGQFVTARSVPIVLAGSVRPVLDIFSGDGTQGRHARYDHFTVWTANPGAGPLSGSLFHEPAIPRVVYAAAGIRPTNFVAEARFVNPYAATTHPWDYGFMFRETGVDQQYRVYVTSAGRWHFSYGAGRDLGSGSVQGLRTGAGESNDLRLIVKGANALLLVNRRPIATLSVSTKVQPGGVDVVTGAVSGDEVQGAATRYRNFVVWSLP
jgi:serine/threonine protein kinase